LLLSVISVIDVVVAILPRSDSKVQTLKGGMCMLKRNVKRVKVVLDNWVVKAILSILGIWLCYPQP